MRTMFFLLFVMIFTAGLVADEMNFDSTTIESLIKLISVKTGKNFLYNAEDGQLKFFVGNECVIDGVYVSEEELNIIFPQWQEKARDTFVSETMDAKRILARLLDFRTTENKSLINQLAMGAREIIDIEEQIIQTEREMDDYVYTLYGLDVDEQRIVELDTEHRANARIPRVQH